MRIISGIYGGRTLKSHERDGLRPTTDRLREAIFNILFSRIDLDGARVLDLFAGTGALGIEALSRGADHCTFVERDKKTAGLIEDNLAVLQAMEQGTVVRGDALHYLAAAEGPFDLIFADPPYAAAVFETLGHVIFEKKLLGESGLFLLEHAATTHPVTPRGATEWLTRAFGDAAISLYGYVVTDTELSRST